MSYAWPLFSPVLFGLAFNKNKRIYNYWIKSILSGYALFLVGFIADGFFEFLSDVFLIWCGVGSEKCNDFIFRFLEKFYDYKYIGLSLVLFFLHYYYVIRHCFRRN